MSSRPDATKSVELTSESVSNRRDRPRQSHGPVARTREPSPRLRLGNRALYVDARDPTRVQELVGQRFDFQAQDLHNLKLLSDRTGAPDVIRADFADLVRPFCQLISDRWYYAMRTRVCSVENTGYDVTIAGYPQHLLPYVRVALVAIRFSVEEGIANRAPSRQSLSQTSRGKRIRSTPKSGNTSAGAFGVGGVRCNRRFRLDTYSRRN